MDALATLPEARVRMAEELADVLIFCLNFANRLDLDLSRSVKEKLVINASKYPVGRARGSAKKYTEI